MSYHEKPGHFLFWSAPRPLRFQIEWSVAHASRADESIFCRVRLIGICRCLHFRVRVPLERRTRRRERGSEKREARHHGKGEEQQYIHTYIYIYTASTEFFLFFSFFFFVLSFFFLFFFFSPLDDISKSTCVTSCRRKVKFNHVVIFDRYIDSNACQVSIRSTWKSFHFHPWKFPERSTYFSTCY